MNFSKHQLLWLLVALITIARLLPHPPNFTPVLAIALFSGMKESNPYQALIVPLLAMFCSDLLIGFHSSMLFVYGSVMVIALAANRASIHQTVLPVFGLTIASSLFFFLVTNFGSWLMMPEIYKASAEGLLGAYVAGLPFLRNAIIGDLVYVALLFGSYHFFIQSFSNRLQPGLTDSRHTRSRLNKLD